MNRLIVPAAVTAFLAGGPAVAEPAGLQTIAEVRAELERIKAEHAPPPEVLARIQAYEEWRRSPWRGGRLGVDPLPVQNVTGLNSVAPPHEM